MLIKIGDGYFEEAAIAAIAPRGIDDAFAVWLTTGQTVHITGSPAEIEAAVESLGFFSADASIMDTGLRLNAAEMLELLNVQELGMEWIARDKDGHVRAFGSKPIFVGAYWQDTSDTIDARRLHEDYSFLVWEDGGAMRIADLLH